MLPNSLLVCFIVLMTITCIGLFANLNAQERRPADAKVMELWPTGEVPLQKPSVDQKEEKWDRWGLINIHTPTLTIYPAKNSTGKTPAILILPGGGYSTVCMNHEGHKVGQWFSEQGVAAFVLKYRCKPYKHPVPLLDAQRGMRQIRHMAKQYNINPNRVGVMGFSAGGHLAATLSTLGNKDMHSPVDAIDKLAAKPDFSVLCYPVITLIEDYAYRGAISNLVGDHKDMKMRMLLSPEKQVTVSTPPAFLIHGDKDTGVIVKNSEVYRDALKAKGVDAELMLLSGKGHGFGFNEQWAKPCRDWINKLYALHP
ncbi:MAG: alpha/beta hydrolase [Phycisphaeraceae bacterium JB051]